MISKRYQMPSMVLIAGIIVQSCGGSDRPGTSDSNENNNQSDVVVPSPDGGHLTNPSFHWKATNDAASYRIRVEDNRGNTFSDQVSAIDADCNNGHSCSYTTMIEMHD